MEAGIVVLDVFIAGGNGKEVMIGVLTLIQGQKGKNYGQLRLLVAWMHRM